MLKRYKKDTSTKDNVEVIFLNKGKKNKSKRDDLGNTREIIDLSKFIYPEMTNLDENGSYTGMTKEAFYDGVLEQPIQDADDL